MKGQINDNSYCSRKRQHELKNERLSSQPRSQGLSSSLPWSLSPTPRKGRRETLGTRLLSDGLIDQWWNRVQSNCMTKS